MHSLPSVISVIGATGTGKSQLAVSLALALNGEIINADAMQQYAGLPIVTNKISVSEQCGVPHHLLGTLDPRRDAASRVGKFVQDADATISSIHARGRIPVVVGGTHYYVQSLLFPHSPSTTPDSESDIDCDAELARLHPVLNADAATVYAKLQEVDPAMAARWHPNDTRKIRRSLAIYYSTGGTQTASEVYAAQRSADPVESNYRNLVLWVHAESDVLRERLDGRVDKMIDAGLEAEIDEMEKMYDELGGWQGGVDVNKGIWQSIGFKEFLPWLQARKEEKEGLEELREKALKEMKSNTRNYAKYQVRWIRIKFINALRAANNADTETLDDGQAQQHHMFLLDSTDVSNYDKNVISTATGISKDFLASQPLPDPLTLTPLAFTNLTPKRDFDISQRPDLWAQNRCDLCDVVTTNLPEWQDHLATRKHKKKLESVKKKEAAKVFIERKKEEQRRKDEAGVGVQEIDRDVEKNS